MLGASSSSDTDMGRSAWNESDCTRSHCQSHWGDEWVLKATARCTTGSQWKEKGERPRVSDEDIARIRQLRREDPATWTRGRLAAEFNCTQWFVGKITSLKRAERKKVVAEVEQAHAANREKWGERKKLSADIRKKRKEFW